jgi:hypothetical protein
VLCTWPDAWSTLGMKGMGKVQGLSAQQEPGEKATRRPRRVVSSEAAVFKSGIDVFKSGTALIERHVSRDRRVECMRRCQAVDPKQLFSNARCLDTSRHDVCQLATKGQDLKYPESCLVLCCFCQSRR